MTHTQTAQTSTGKLYSLDSLTYSDLVAIKNGLQRLGDRPGMFAELEAICSEIKEQDWKEQLRAAGIN